MAKKKTMQLWTLNKSDAEGTHFTLAQSGTWPALLARMRVNSGLFPANYFVKYPDGSFKPLMT